MRGRYGLRAAETSTRQTAQSLARLRLYAVEHCTANTDDVRSHTALTQTKEKPGMTAAVTPTRSSSAPVPPARIPDSRRKFQLTEFGDNHNKWWQVEVWDLGGGAVHMRTTWGRVGATPQSKD